MLGPHRLVDVVGGAVRAVGHGPQHGQPLGGDLQAVAAERGARLRHLRRTWLAP